MDFLQHLNPGTAGLLIVGLCGLCLVLPILLTGAHFIAVIVGAVSHVFSLIAHVISGGPLQWCGCLVAIGGCGVLALTTWLVYNGLANCATYHSNFCALVGR